MLNWANIAEFFGRLTQGSGWVARVRRAPQRWLTTSDSQSVSALLAEARRVDPDITEDELAAARLCASEYDGGSPYELACLVDAELNRAHDAGKTLTESLTSGGRYGAQGGARPAATRRNTKLRHLVAARAVLGGEARGIARGATRFFNPRVQDLAHRKWKAQGGKVHSCSAEGILKAWAFDLPSCIRTSSKVRRCCADGLPPADAQPGRQRLEWVGRMPGVDAYRLCLMRPSVGGIGHRAAYERAAAMIRSGNGKGTLVDSPTLAAGALLALAMVL